MSKTNSTQVITYQLPLTKWLHVSQNSFILKQISPLRAKRVRKFDDFVWYLTRKLYKSVLWEPSDQEMLWFPLIFNLNVKQMDPLREKRAEKFYHFLWYITEMCNKRREQENLRFPYVKKKIFLYEHEYVMILCRI